MITALHLAGFLAAHAIWCVADGETLVPMLAFTDEEDQRRMERLLIDDDLQKSVSFGRNRLASNDMDANDAALLYDGFVTVGDEKLDAIVIEVRAYFSPGSEVTVAVPYTPRGDDRFRVHRPKILQWQQCDDFDIQTAFEAFFEGVHSHEMGAPIWSDALDESK